MHFFPTSFFIDFFFMSHTLICQIQKSIRKRRREEQKEPHQELSFYLAVVFNGMDAFKRKSITT